MAEWRLVSEDPYLGVRRYELDLDESSTIVKTEFYAAEQFFERNKELLKASDGQRFGDGRSVASVPMHIWSRELAPAIQNGDQAYIKKWLNDADNVMYRTFRGTV